MFWQVLDALLSQHFHVTTLPCHNTSMSQHFHVTTLPCHNTSMSQHFHVTTLPCHINPQMTPNLSQLLISFCGSDPIIFRDEYQSRNSHKIIANYSNELKSFGFFSEVFKSNHVLSCMKFIV